MFPEVNAIIIKSIMNLSLIMNLFLIIYLLRMYLLNNLIKKSNKNIINIILVSYLNLIFYFKNEYIILFLNFSLVLILLIITTYLRLRYGLITSGFLFNAFPYVITNIQDHDLIVSGTFIESVFLHLGERGAIVASSIISEYICVNTDLTHNFSTLISGDFTYNNSQGTFYFLKQKFDGGSNTSNGTFKLVVNNLNWIELLNNNIQNTFLSHFGVLNSESWNNPGDLLQYRNNFPNNHLYHEMSLTQIEHSNIINRLNFINPNWRENFNIN
uniref:hypothetical protein n=1 Tax=Hericium alpestre TaxID=135208 RepID=UPI002435134D|nr:hypothetical protein QEO35_mgp09 [Hericium alpestre]WEX32024.1 hypothetical protein [Hericium alpestre]